jgi:hypothetical protein
MADRKAALLGVTSKSVRTVCKVLGCSKLMIPKQEEVRQNALK